MLWRDEIDSAEFDRTGNALLYRNPLKKTIDETDYFIYSSVPSDPSVPGLFTTTPIAYGFTAYAAEYNKVIGIPLRYRLMDEKWELNRDDIFNRYLQHVFKFVNNKNNRSANKLPEAELRIQFFREHVEQERQKLVLSEKYYTECHDDQDNLLKAKMKVWAETYIKVIGDLIPKLSDTIPESLKCNPIYTLEKLKQLHKLLIDNKQIKQDDPVNNFLYVFGACKKPENWQKVYWIGSRKNCFSFMMDMCGDDIKAKAINEFIQQNAINPKTKNRNTKPLEPKDRWGCKRGFVDNLK